MFTELWKRQHATSRHICCHVTSHWLPCDVTNFVLRNFRPHLIQRRESSYLSYFERPWNSQAQCITSVIECDIVWHSYFYTLAILCNKMTILNCTVPNRRWLQRCLTWMVCSSSKNGNLLWTLCTSDLEVIWFSTSSPEKKKFSWTSDLARVDLGVGLVHSCSSNAGVHRTVYPVVLSNAEKRDCLVP